MMLFFAVPALLGALALSLVGVGIVIAAEGSRYLDLEG
jgi:hypothetical protein